MIEMFKGKEAIDIIKLIEDRVKAEVEVKTEDLRKDILREVESKKEVMAKEIEKAEAWLRDVRVKPMAPWEKMPEWTIMKGDAFMTIADAAIRDFGKRYPPYRGSLCYDLSLILGEPKSDFDRISWIVQENRLFVLGGFKNKGCQGKYRVERGDRWYATFYLRKEEIAVAIVPTMLEEECYFGVRKLEGEQPSFEPIGVGIMPSRGYDC